jgi:hypothetical protein
MDFKILYNHCSFIISDAPHLTDIILKELRRVDELIASNKDERFIQKTCQESFRLVTMIHIEDSLH